MYKCSYQSNRADDRSLTSIFPDIPQVSRLWVCEPKCDDTDYIIWLKALQGIANRVEPIVYVLNSKSTAEKHWLDYYVNGRGIPLERRITPEELLDEFAGVIKGYVVYDNKDVIQTQNLAITLCGLESVLPVSPEWEQLMLDHGIKKTDDLRGRFSDDYAAAEWAVDNLWPRCYKRMFGSLCIHRPSWYAMNHDLVDYLVYNRVFCLDMPRCRIYRKYLALYDRMMQTAEAPGVQLNWHCIWAQEKEYIAEATKRGFFSLCSISTPNMTIHGGVGDPAKSYVGSQPLPPKSECVAEKGKVYVCLYNSDGDATWAMHSLHSDNWLNPDRGSFPFGWGFLPLMTKMMPACLEYYQQTRLPNDCFWGPSSGAAYTYSWLWPDDLATNYLSESRRLLDQSGQNGCNMVNWFLQDYWREVNCPAAVEREKRVLGGPGLVCGLGGSPYAKSYPNGAVPKLHSVHIANVGNNNFEDIYRFARECPTRPAFLFLFAQIAPGIFKQIDSELESLKDHPEVELLSMDKFFLTLQDASARGLVNDELYEKTDALAETWLREPGRHRLPLYVNLTEELADAAHDEPAHRRERLAKSGYTQLVSGEIEGIAPSREAFVGYFKERAPIAPEFEADCLFYSAFTVAWGVARSVLEANGIYANERNDTFRQLREICGAKNTSVFDEMNAAWSDWPNGTPNIETTVLWCDRVRDAAKAFSDKYGDSGEFHGWPPKSI